MFGSSGIEIADKLSIIHINESLRNLGELEVEDSEMMGKEIWRDLVYTGSPEYQALLGVALKVKTRKY